MFAGDFRTVQARGTPVSSETCQMAQDGTDNRGLQPQRAKTHCSLQGLFINMYI